MKAPLSFVIILLFILLFGSSQPGTGWAMEPDSPRVVFLTSIDRPELFEKWETIIHQEFNLPDFQVRIIHRATSVDLWESIHSSNTIALFWLSHAGFQPFAPGLENAIIADVSGTDMSPLFKEPPKHLKWLSVIGCRSEGPLQQLRRAGAFRGNPDLQVNGEENPVEASASLRSHIGRAVEWFKGHPEIYKTAIDAEKRQTIGYMRLTRHAQSVFDPMGIAQIQTNRRVLSVFPNSADSREVQSQVIPIFADEWNSNNPFRMIMRLAEFDPDNSRQNRKIGILDAELVLADGRLFRWELLRNKKGESLAGPTQLYTPIELQIFASRQTRYSKLVAGRV